MSRMPHKLWVATDSPRVAETYLQRLLCKHATD